MLRSIASLCAVLLLASAVTANAAAPALQHGDVLAGGDAQLLIDFLPPLDWIRAGAALPPHVSARVYGAAFAPDGRLFVSDWTVLLAWTPALTFSTARAGDLSGLAFDRAGTLFAVNSSGSLLELAPNGSVRRTAPLVVSEQVVAIDLDRDQCTLYIASLHRTNPMHRFDVCT